MTPTFLLSSALLRQHERLYVYYAFSQERGAVGGWAEMDNLSFLAAQTAVGSPRAPQWKRGSCVSSTEVIILLFCGLACLVYKSCHLCVLHQHHLGQYKYLCHCLGRKWVEYLTSQLDFELGSPLCLSCNSQDGRWLEPSHPSLGPQMGVRLSLLSVGRLFGFRS